MKVKIVTILLVLSLIIVLDSCDDFLDFSPKGTLTEEQALSLENAEKLVNAAYAAIGNDFWDRSITSMWVYGSVRSDDAYKGGGSVQDQFTINRFEQYNLTTPDITDYLPIDMDATLCGRFESKLCITSLNAFTDDQLAYQNYAHSRNAFLKRTCSFRWKVDVETYPIYRRNPFP